MDLRSSPDAPLTPLQIAAVRIYVERSRMRRSHSLPSEPGALSLLVPENPVAGNPIPGLAALNNGDVSKIGDTNPSPSPCEARQADNDHEGCHGIDVAVNENPGNCIPKDDDLRPQLLSSTPGGQSGHKSSTKVRVLSSNTEKISPRPASTKRDSYDSLFPKNIPPRGYKSLQRKPAPELTTSSPKTSAGDGFSSFEAYPSGNVQGGKKRKCSQVSAGLGPLELTQTTNPVTQAVQRKKRKTLNCVSFDFEGWEDDEAGQQKLRKSSTTNTEAWPEREAGGLSSSPSAETVQGEPNQARAQLSEPDGSTSRYFNAAPSTFSADRSSKFEDFEGLED